MTDLTAEPHILGTREVTARTVWGQAVADIKTVLEQIKNEAKKQCTVFRINIPLIKVLSHCTDTPS